MFNKSRLLCKLFDKRVSGIRFKNVWSSDNVISSPFDDIVIPNMPMSDYVWRNLDKWSNKTAIVCAVSDRKYTYHQVYKQTKTLGANLRKKFKLKDGDAVAVMLPNLPEYPTIVLGVLTAGCLVSTLNPIYTSYEVQRQLVLSQPKLVVAVPETVPVIKEALRGSKIDIPIIVVDADGNRPDNTVSFKELVEDNHVDLDILKEVKVNSDDVSFLLYSSGTTGLPKGVELTNNNIVANCEQQTVDGCKLYEDTTETNQDVVLAYLPMFHSYGLTIVTLQKLSVGLKIVSFPKFQPDTFLKGLEKHKFTVFYMAPPTVLFLASSPEANSKHFERLKNVIVAAAPSAMADIEAFISKVGHDIHFAQAYGLTETSPLATMCPVGLNVPRSVGYAIPNVKLRVVDDKMKNLGPNELGELLISGPNVMRGYKNNPEANAQVFAEGGWLKSGDLVRITEKGCVYVADRLKELIKVNAYQVPPAELENVIKDHPAVLDAAVIGIPDEKSGEKPKAYIILNKGSNITEKDIMDFVSERVAPFKRLKEVQFTDNIQKNPTGKILRRLLLEQHLKEQKQIS